jgi:hypothetical protein
MKIMTACGILRKLRSGQIPVIQTLMVMEFQIIWILFQQKHKKLQNREIAIRKKT